MMWVQILICLFGNNIPLWHIDISRQQLSGESNGVCVWMWRIRPHYPFREAGHDNENMANVCGLNLMLEASSLLVALAIMGISEKRGPWRTIKALIGNRWGTLPSTITLALFMRECICCTRSFLSRWQPSMVVPRVKLESIRAYPRLHYWISLPLSQASSLPHARWMVHPLSWAHLATITGL